MTERCRACDAELPPPAATGGQRRRYCSDACRSGAYRRRRATRDLLPGDPPGLLPEDVLEKLTDFAFVRNDDPYASAVEIMVTLQAVANRCRHLALAAPEPLAWRHERTVRAVAEILTDLWPVE